jgi:hypothetical protein
VIGRKHDMLGKVDSYGVFVDEERGPTWKAFTDDLEGAKAQVQQTAAEDGVEVFIFSFKDCGEVARFFPKLRVAGRGQP